MLFRNPHERMHISRKVTIKYSTAKTSAVLNLAWVVKYWAVHFDEHLTLQDHMERSWKKLRTVSSHIYGNISVCSASWKLKVFRALGECVMQYDLNIYDLYYCYKMHATYYKTCNTKYSWRFNVWKCETKKNNDTVRHMNYRLAKVICSMVSKLFFKWAKNKSKTEEIA